MKWISIKNQPFPDSGENTNFLVTDGKSVHVAYIDKEQLWFRCDPYENYGGLEERLTHWISFNSVPLPQPPKDTE